MDKDIDPKILEEIRRLSLSSDVKFNRFFGDLTPETKNVLETIIRHYVEDHRIQPKQTTYFNQTKYHRFQPKYGRVQSKYDYFLIFGNLGVVPKSTCVTILFFPL